MNLQGDSDLQRRARKLLLEALRTWQANGCDCGAIEHVLRYLQNQIFKFEATVGKIESAAAGATWSSIKQIVHALLLCKEVLLPESSMCSQSRPLVVDSLSALHATPSMDSPGCSPTQAADERKSSNRSRGRLERQSGVQNICWESTFPSWRIRWYTSARKRRSKTFPLDPFMKQGLSEDEAIQAALRQARPNSKVR